MAPLCLKLKKYFSNRKIFIRRKIKFLVLNLLKFPLADFKFFTYVKIQILKNLILRLILQTVEMRREGKLLKIFFEQMTTKKSCFNLKVLPSSDENVKHLEKRSKAKIYNFAEKGEDFLTFQDFYQKFTFYLFF